MQTLGSAASRSDIATFIRLRGRASPYQTVRTGPGVGRNSLYGKSKRLGTARSASHRGGQKRRMPSGVQRTEYRKGPVPKVFFAYFPLSRAFWPSSRAGVNAIRSPKQKDTNPRPGSALSGLPAKPYGGPNRWHRFPSKVVSKDYRLYGSFSHAGFEGTPHTE